MFTTAAGLLAAPAADAAAGAAAVTPMGGTLRPSLAVGTEGFLTLSPSSDSEDLARSRTEDARDERLPASLSESLLAR